MNIPEQLSQLWTLKQSGALTDNEYTEAKSKIICIKKDKKVITKIADDITSNEDLFEEPCHAQIELRKHYNYEPNNITFLWSNDLDDYLIDHNGDKYHFGEVWKNLEHIRIIYKNDEKYKPGAGIHRGYKMWLDDKQILHIAHGHQNVNNISHMIMVDDYSHEGWECDFNPLPRRIRIEILEHFNMI